MYKDKNKVTFHILLNKIKFLMAHPKAAPHYIASYLIRSFPKSRQNVIVSYPKSGRTWLEQLLLKVIIDNYGLNKTKFKHFDDLLLLQNNAPYILLTHACSSWEAFKIYGENDIAQINANKKSGERTLFLYRDPRDVLVSSYYHLRFRNKINILPKDIIYSPIFGLRKMIIFMNLWLTYVQNNGQSLMISYESLHKEQIASLKKICTLFKLNACDDVLKNAINACSFSTMQKKEKSAISPRLSTAINNEPNSRKVRSGKIGEHRSFFSDDELNDINQIISSELDPSFGYHS